MVKRSNINEIHYNYIINFFKLYNIYSTIFTGIIYRFNIKSFIKQKY